MQYIQRVCNENECRGRKQMRNIPCEDCITLPICKATLYRNFNNSDPPLMDIYSKCKIIKYWCSFKSPNPNNDKPKPMEEFSVDRDRIMSIINFLYTNNKVKKVPTIIDPNYHINVPKYGG